MKVLFIISAALIGIFTWSCTDHRVRLEPINDDSTLPTAIGEKGSISRSGDTLPNCDDADLQASPKEPDQDSNFRVDVFVDKRLDGSHFFRKGVLFKDVVFNPGTETKRTQTEYFYKNNGEYDLVKIDGRRAIGDQLIEIEQWKLDYDFQASLVQCKGIKLPAASELLASEVRDLAITLSLTDNYHDFDIAIETEGNRKRIKFVDFNKTSRYQHSPMAMLIGEGYVVKVRNYELTLEEGYPLKEIYETDQGTVIKTYLYQNNKCISVTYQYTDLQNQSTYWEKRLEFHKLR